MNVIFDLDDTLYDLEQPFWRAYQKLWEGRYETDSFRLFLRFRHYNNAVYEKFLAGTISYEELGIFRIQRAMEEQGHQVSPEAALEFQRAYEGFQKDLKLSPAVAELLEELKSRGAALGILTNGLPDRQMNKIHSLGLERWILTEHIFVSGAIGAAKPMPEAFAFVEQQMGLKKEETWFVGDSVTHDLLGAKQAGWRMVLLKRKGREQSVCEFAPDAVAESEEELLRFFQKLRSSGKPF